MELVDELIFNIKEDIYAFEIDPKSCVDTFKLESITFIHLCLLCNTFKLFVKLGGCLNAWIKIGGSGLS